VRQSGLPLMLVLDNTGDVSLNLERVKISAALISGNDLTA
jgi:hypothetical protein